MRSRIRSLLTFAAIVATSAAFATNAQATGECDATCPFDQIGKYHYCEVELDGVTCVYTDNDYYYYSGGSCYNP